MAAAEAHGERWRVLLTGLRLGPVEVPNRLAFGPHCPVFVDAAGRPTDEFAAYFAERARGGAGLVIIGASPVDPGGTIFPTALPAMYDDGTIDGLRKTADAVHAQGSRLFIQLVHAGLDSAPGGLRDPVAGDPDGPLVVVAPSALPSPTAPGVVAHELTEPEILALIEAFGAAAARAAAAGLDGVEVQAGIGALVEQFLSPLYNRRADSWGGPLENRARFLLAIVARIRAAVGNRLAIGVRLALDQMLPGGYGLDEGRRIVGLLEEQGAYDYLNTCLGGAPHIHFASLYMPLAFEREMVADVRTVATRPVFINTRILSPIAAGELIADGVADMVSMVRQLIADPDTLRKAVAGQIEEIRPCLSCNQWCVGNVNQGLKASCVVNPRAGRETRLPRATRAAAPRRVLIVGGGPAGLKAAEQAAERGHRVVLHEAGDTLGGAVRLAAMLPGRSQMAAAVDYLVGRVARLGADVRLGSRLDAPAVLEAVAADGIDDVVVATGATRATLGWNGVTGAAIPGAEDSPLVLTVDEVLGGRRPGGPRVLVYDEPGDVMATGVAELLGAEGYAVELVTRWPQVSPQMAVWGLAFHVESRLQAAGVRQFTGHLVTAVTPTGSLLRDLSTGQETEHEADAVLLVGAPRSDTALYDQLQPLVPGDGAWRLHRIGDALSPRSIGEAIFEGDRVARHLSAEQAGAAPALAALGGR